MTICSRIIAAAVVAAGLAAPAAAQYPYPTQPYPQTYPTYPGQPYGGGNVIGSVIDQLLGNRYSVTDRSAVSRCAGAAVAQAANQYRAPYQQGYAQGYPQPYGGYGYNQIRVTAITSVERRSSGLRVRGLLDSGMGYGMYGGQYGGGQYGYDPRYSQGGDLSFRCTVDWRGYVSDVRIRRR